MLEKQKVRNTKTNIGSDMNLLMMEAAIKNEQLENINECGDIERSHGMLSRTISYPQPHNQQDSNVTQLVTTIIENLGNMNLHRKLERTQSEPLPQQANTSRYKTELCRPFEEAGECKYGEKCQFAHGFQELRNLQRHPKYKTEYCRTFHSVGFCPYGPRCHFVHNQDEARAMQQMQTKIQNHSNNNTTYQNGSQVTSTFSMGSASPKHVTAVGAQLINHSLPLSPPLSMSTGSDRESPTGSLSISPTNSITSFPFVDQISPTNSIFHTAFSYVNTTPPDSPNAPISPVNTPPPNLVLGGLQGNSPVVAMNNNTSMYVTPIINASQICGSVNAGGKRALKKTCSSPVTILHSNSSILNNNGGGVSAGGTEADARLPVFNCFSLSDDFFPSNVAT